MAHAELPALAVAVLIVGDRYALQHRDDDPAIAWPGHWGLFGGAIEPGETPEASIGRELHEELGLRFPQCRRLWATDDHRDAQGRPRSLFVFEVDATEAWPRHELHEGQGAGLFAAEDLPAVTVPTARAIIERHRRAARSAP